MAFENLDDIKRGLRAFATKVVVKLVFDITANLRAAPDEGGTPVDTGWARANWIPSIAQSVDEPFGSRVNVSSDAQDAGLASVGAYTLDLGQIYVTNPVPYIQSLNDGHSQQAPAGFVERAIEKAVFEDSQGLAA